MFIAVVVIFAICWLPYHMFYVYAYHKPHITSKSYVPHLFLGFYWLAMSNSMVNPIIYYWMNRRFRHYFQKIMCFCCFHLWRKNELYKSETVYMPNSRSLSIERRSKSCKYSAPAIPSEFHFHLWQWHVNLICLRSSYFSMPFLRLLLRQIASSVSFNNYIPVITLDLQFWSFTILIKLYILLLPLKMSRFPFDSLIECKNL